MVKFFLAFLLIGPWWNELQGAETDQAPTTISSNPGAVNVQVGTGKLGEALGLKSDSGIRLGGLEIGDLNYLYCGGFKPRSWSKNYLLILSLSVDLQKVAQWKGALFNIDFLQFNGEPTNEQAGCVQGYNSLPGPRPLNRSELYQIWLRQELFQSKLVFRIGKVIPTYDFNNVIKPLPLQESSLVVPATTGLIYTPIFVNPTLLGVIPGYYNSAWGMTITWTPNDSFYLATGIYDGNLARGKQTGLRGPEFNGYYFGITEIGLAWGFKSLPGNIGIGVWRQSGELKGPNSIRENGTEGIYLFGTQRLWRTRPQKDSSGIISFYQLGYNNSKTLPVNRYIGGGLTFLGLVPGRLDDSFGFGIALSRLNHRLFSRRHEMIVQAYYEAPITPDCFFLTALSYIPKPGADPSLKKAWASTARLIVLF